MTHPLKNPGYAPALVLLVCGLRAILRREKRCLNDPRVLHKKRTHSTHALIFGGKIIACPTVDGQATGGVKLFTNYNALSFSWVAIYSKT